MVMIHTKLQYSISAYRILRPCFGDEKLNHPIDSGNEFIDLLQSHWRKEKERANPLGLKSQGNSQQSTMFLRIK